MRKAANSMTCLHYKLQFYNETKWMKIQSPVLAKNYNTIYLLIIIQLQIILLYNYYDRSNVDTL